jgi:small nuclear ribonucleoprotein (snRNP)-like protein/Skp family chaperone for outer membrane proteins
MLMDIGGLNISLKGDFTENITNLKIEGGANQLTLDYDGIQYMKQVKILLDMMLEMNLEEAKYTFIENEFRVNELPLSFDGWVAMPSDAIDMDLTFQAKKTEFKEILSLVPAEFTQDLEGVETSGKMSLSGFAKGIYLEENYPSFGAKLQVENARFQYPDLPKSVEDIQIIASVENLDGNLDHTVVDVPKFHLVMADNPFDINVLLKTPMSDPYLKAGMKGKIILDNIKDVIPLEKNDELTGQFIADLAIEGNLSTIEKEQYEDFKANGTIQAMNIHYNSDSMDYPVDVKEAEMIFSPQFVALNKMNVKLGESDIQATGRLENFIGYAMKDNQVLKGNLVMTSTYMNLDELAGMEDEGVPAAEGETSEDTSLMEVVLVPKNIDFTMSTIIGKVLYDGLVVENINGAINLKDQKISMKDASMNLLEGSMVMNGFYETTDSLAPSFDFSMNIIDFDVQQTVKNFNTVEQLAPLAKYGKGRYSNLVDIKGKLDQNMEPNFESMSGQGEIKTKSIAIEGYKPLTKIAEVLKYDKLTPLVLNDVSISFQIVGGKVFVEPFTNKIGKTEMTISGSNSFDQTIDYVFAFAIPREEFGGAANQAIDGLLAKAAANGVNLSSAVEVVNVDVTLKGPATDPKVGTNFKNNASGAKDALKAKAQAELDAAKQKAKEELEKKKKELEDKGKEELEKQKQKAQEELEKQKQKAEEELQKQKEAAKKKLEDEAKKKLKGLLGK